MFTAKGMVEFGETTYRIAEVGRGKYQAFRVLDNVRIGTFDTVPTLRISANGADEKVLLAVARTALMQGKTAWRASVPDLSAQGVALVGAEVRSAADARLRQPHQRSGAWLKGLSLTSLARLWRGMLPEVQPSDGAPA